MFKSNTDDANIAEYSTGRSLFYVLSTSKSSDQVSLQLDVFSARVQCSRVSERVTSLSDVALTDIESLDTATESTESGSHN